MTPQFGFRQARAIVPYLDRLGISDLYCSPILMARPGSQHGYDVTDAAHLNPELGTEDEFDALVEELKRHDMGLLLDIVPNHMAASTDNPWWSDVLENGRSSPYAHYFDIEWDAPVPGSTLLDRVLLPILGSPYGETLESGELRLVVDDGLKLAYYGTHLPLSLKSYIPVLSQALSELEGTSTHGRPEIMSLQMLSEDIRTLTESDADQSNLNERRRDKRDRVLEGFCRLIDDSSAIRAAIERALEQINGIPGDARSFDQLDQIISSQAYRLAFWQLARERINYRRFFDINDLVSMRVEDEDVFADTHRLIVELARDGKITGVRVDHIDGLHDPKGYLERLRRSLTGGPGSAGGGCSGFYVVAEKILAQGESLPDDWSLCGTTGYDFMNEVNGIFIDAGTSERLDEIYRRAADLPGDFPELAYQKKRQVLTDLFEANVRSLVVWLDQIAEHDRHGRDITFDALELALVEATAYLPVYRTYIHDYHVTRRDQMYVQRAIDAAAGRHPDLRQALAFLRRVLLLRFPTYLPEGQRESWLGFVMRWQQFTGPVMAKGVEDTALYIYNRLLSQNEVGGHPELPGLSLDAFHQRNLETARSWPHTLNATSTHDTKRSEDLRARLDAISEIPDEWDERLTRWRELNAAKRSEVAGAPVPDPNVELLVYQTLLGVWPLQLSDRNTVLERVTSFLEKAGREAKLYTTWGSPNAEYEAAVAAFARTLLDPAISSEFLEDFESFEERLAFSGMLTSLSQTLLKMTVPGIPDFYQGTELWSFSLVDPDNRRPVDYQRRSRMLAGLEERGGGASVSELLESWIDGRIKLHLIRSTLALRAAHPDLFADGAYLPLQTSGSRADHLIAFARRRGRRWAVVVAPRLTATLTPAGAMPLGEACWGDTRIALPDGAPDRWQQILTGETVEAYNDDRCWLLAQHVLRLLPVGLLAAE
jgi:(1->4)-alpha-D-glucan 1-alpha-D-glucosylmutase